MKPNQVVGGVLGALTAALLLFGVRGSSHPAPKPVADPAEAADAKPDEPLSKKERELRLKQAMDACEAYADPARVSEWDRAIEQCKVAIALDPNQGHALTANGRFASEHDNKASYDHGQATAQMGSRSEALDALTPIELWSEEKKQESIYLKPAKALFQKVAHDVLEAEHVKCAPSEPMDPAVRWPHCDAYARVACHLGFAPDAQAAFDALKPAHPGWKCPEVYGAMLGIEEKRETNTALQREIAAKYPDAALAAVVTDYARDDLDTVKKLNRFKPVSGAERTALEKALLDAIADFDKQHERFTVSMTHRDVEQSQAAWEAAMKLDGAIMPPGLQSATAHAMTFDLATRYISLANQAYINYGYSESLGFCAHAEAVMPTHAAIAECKEVLTYPRVQDALCTGLRREKSLARKGSAHLAEVVGWMKDHHCP